MTLSEALPKLRAPFTAAAVRWKIQANPKGPQGKALVVGFIDSRLVTERLNDVVGGDWSDEYGPLVGTHVTCRLTVLGSSRVDVGWSAEVGSDKGVKTAYSDALKRAAVKFGIGAFLYAMPQRWVPANLLKQAGNSYVIPGQTATMLATRYSEWLAEPGVVKRFGAPIDHGDAGPVAEPGDGQQQLPGSPAAPPVPGPANALTEG